MARLEGIIKFSGALGDLVAYQRNGKWVLRRKSSLTKKRVRNDPAFQRSREASKEFGGASTISKYIRDRLRVYTSKDKDGSAYHRLNSLLYSYIKAGQGDRGQRTFSWNDIQTTFTEFNFNHASSVNMFLNKLPIIERVDNQINWSVDEIHLITSPQGTTHFQLTLLFLELPNFTVQEKYIPESEGAPLIIEALNMKEVNESCVQAGTILLPSTNLFLICCSITFLQNVNNEMYPLQQHPLTWYEIT